MESRGSPAAARSAAVLGSRNARRQLKSVLAAAAEVGAYSVGFSVARGGLTGFSIYFAGDFAGACKGSASAAAFTCAAPRPSGAQQTGHALPTTARAAATAAPAGPAAARKRDCREGARKQQRRQGASERAKPTAPADRHAAPLEGGTRAALLHKHDNDDTHVPAAPHVPPLHRAHPAPSSLSPFAPAFSPPPPPPSLPPSPGEEDPLSLSPGLRHLLPHAQLSYEEQRWEYYYVNGGPFPPHGSSRKRPEPPSPPWPPTSAVVGCTVNERRARPTPPPLPVPRLPPSRGC